MPEEQYGKDAAFRCGTATVRDASTRNAIYITGRIAFRKPRRHALSLFVLALHTSVVLSAARDSRCNGACPLSCRPGGR